MFRKSDNSLLRQIIRVGVKPRPAGRIHPKYTSQECPNGHAIAKKALSQRVHRCDCGLTIGRDQAAAFVILRRGLRLQAQTAGQLAPVA